MHAIFTIAPTNTVKSQTITTSLSSDAQSADWRGNNNHSALNPLEAKGREWTKNQGS